MNDARAQVTIVNARGLHARAARKFVQCAREFDARVTVALDQHEVSAESIMEVLMLAAPKDSAITIAATGSEAPAAVERLVALVQDGFGEL